MQRILLPLLAVLSLPTAVNADNVYKVKDARAKWGYELISQKVSQRLGLNPKIVNLGDTFERKSDLRVDAYCRDFFGKGRF